VFAGDLAAAAKEENRMSINRLEHFENPRGLHSTYDERYRYEFCVTAKTVKLSVETVTDPRTGKSVTASTDEIGPPNSQVTWRGLANAVTAVIGYAIPINRLSMMLKQACPYFTSSRICSHLKLAAEMFEPIYTHLGEALADAPVLMGDDTPTRVLELNEALKDGGEVAEPKSDGLIAKIANLFGRVFDKKRQPGKKRQVNVSVVIGKTEPRDRRSYIFFFRTHLGSFGDLVSQMLEMRDPKKKDVTIVSDLATTNLVSPELHERFNIRYAGCAAHARRPFWRHRNDEPRICHWMLSAFLVLEHIEERIDALGRTSETILKLRGKFGRKVWEAMRKRCESVMRGEAIYGNYWPKLSHIYKACEYFAGTRSCKTRVNFVRAS